MKEQLILNDIPTNPNDLANHPFNEDYLNAWGWKRIVAGLASGGVSELGNKILNRDPETGVRIDNVGGDKWSEAQAKKFYSQTAGKVDNVRRITGAIIGTDPANVKPNHKGDFAGILNQAQIYQKDIELRWNYIQEASKDFSKPENRAIAKEQYTQIWHQETWALKADDQRHIWSTVRTIDKVAQGAKTVNLAPLRAMGEVFLRLNVFNMATIFKIASVRKPAEFETQVRYKWKQIGGNRTKFDKAINAGYKKKPILGKQMDISDLGFNGSYNADGDLPIGVVAPKEEDSNAKLKTATADINAITANMPVKQADPSKKTLEIPAGVIASIPALSLAFGATLGASADRAVTAATAGAWGGVVSGLFGAINAMKIPLKANETQPALDGSALKVSDIDAGSEEKRKAGRLIGAVSNWVTVPVITVVLAGTVFGVFKLINKKNK